ncbi:MAG: hypothetical protein Q9160_002404 [Pyrenula sp. 1 TL-2023]
MRTVTRTLCTVTGRFTQLDGFVAKATTVAPTLLLQSLYVALSSDLPFRQPHSASTKPLRVRLLSKLTPHENIYTVPNILTFSRLLAAPVVGYLVVTQQHGLALGLFFYAGVTDLIDGYIARRYSLQTVVGTVIDPMADKALMTISAIALAIQGALPLWLVSLILMRDIGLGIAAIYYRWISLTPPKTMARYWDFSLPSAEVKPTEISKFNTFLQLLLVGAGMGLPVVPEALVKVWYLDTAFECLKYDKSPLTKVGYH